MLLFALTIFLAAFLLFQVQPLVAKIILPWFGGASAVWSTAMLFFQAALLAGYLYAHWLHEKLSPRRQALAHTALLALSLLALPLAPDASWKGTGLENPEWRLLGLLATAVGLPYFLLSTTSPLIQAWYARTHSGAVPYRLYALSNLGSMLGLLSYPALVEPRLAVRTQSLAWSAGYTVFALLCGVAAWKSLGAGRSPEAVGADPAPPAPSWGLRLLWMGLAGCASTLLLATTAYLTQDVAAIPFLWVVPLSVYLLSFIVCFEAPQVYDRRIWLPLAAGALIFMGYLISPEGPWYKVPEMILAATGSLFVCAMVCHGEIVRSKPHPRHLTGFYLMIALGGALGGVFVGLAAPNLFNAYYELQIGLVGCGLLAALMAARERRARWIRTRERLVWTAVAVALAGYAVWLAHGVRSSFRDMRVVARNFYGQLRVKEVDEEDGMGVRRKLVHGVINHGEQILREDFRRRPGTYFCPESGVGRLLNATRQGPPRRIGVLGLGCGTLAAYGRPGDVIRFYEINPLVPVLANSQFTYLRDSPARIEIVLGDGRLMLEREPPQNFDVLVMDAFSGDSVPVHLITREAFRIYLRHLRPGGVLALNISNRFLDFRPVMERAARAFGKAALLAEYEADEEELECFSSSWVLMMDEVTRAALGPALGDMKPLEARADFRLWTDDYSSIFGILR